MTKTKQSTIKLYDFFFDYMDHTDHDILWEVGTLFP